MDPDEIKTAKIADQRLKDEPNLRIEPDMEYSDWLDQTGLDDSFVGDVTRGIPGTGHLFEAAERHMNRYVVADADQGEGWSHIFTEDGKEVERMTRLVFDRQENAIVHLDIQFYGSWQPASAAEKSDVLDSLTHANEEAMLFPPDYGVTAATHLPDWARPAEPALSPN